MPWASLSRALRRSLRYLRSPPPVDFIYSRDYAFSHPSVPSDPLRGERILTFLSSEGLLRPRKLHSPRSATVRSLRRIHSDDYLHSLREEETLAGIVGTTEGLAVLDRFLEVQRRMVGGTQRAVQLALDRGGLAIHLGGGLHHAWSDQGGGFCMLNDVAVAIAAARAQGFEGRILVVDLDLHHGDGTEAIFAQDASVYTYSIHNRAWSETEAVANTRIELGFEVQDPAYLTALRESLPPIVESFSPQLVFFLAGCDPAQGDAIGDWKISAEGMLERDLFVLSLLERGGSLLPTVIVLAGGYGSESWRFSARFFGALERGGKPLEPPTTGEITLLRYRHIARLQDPLELSDTTAEGDDWELTEEDILGPLASTPQATRFLGFYTRHGLELALERYGIFDRLREQGFERPYLDWNLDDISGQTVRIYGDADRKELLGEFRARRDRRRIPGMEMLHIEWLLLQNPRARFSTHRPSMPGQEYPGLGLLRDVLALLIIACERLQLDGISFVPSHFHLALTSANLMHFLDPKAEVRLAAVREALGERNFAKSVALVAAGGVVDKSTGEAYRWEPTVLLQPVSDRLEAYFETPEYRREKRQAQASAPTFEAIDDKSSEASRPSGSAPAPPAK